LAFTSSGRLMRILGSVVAPSAALMAFCDSKIMGCGSIRPQLIRDELVWDKAIFLQQLAHEFQRRPLVPPALDQHVEHFALGVILIDGVARPVAESGGQTLARRRRARMDLARVR